MPLDAWAAFELAKVSKELVALRSPGSTYPALDHPCNALPSPLPCVAAVRQLCETRDLAGCRAALLNAILGTSEPPADKPLREIDAQHSWPASVQNNFTTGLLPAIVPSMLVWPITSSRLGHREESTVLYYRSTSAQRSIDTIVLYHHGHSESGGDCVPHLNSLPKRMSDAGYDVMELWMPLMNCRKMEANAGKSNTYEYMKHLTWIKCRELYRRGSRGKTIFNHAERGHHSWYSLFDFPTANSSGKPALRYFVEPVLLAVAHARRQGYRNVVLVGMSGGAWTVLVAASLLADVNLTVPIAGTCRDEILKPREASGDFHFERTHMQHLVDDRQLYRMAALERGRVVLQIYHERDIRSGCPAPRSGWSRIRMLDGNVSEWVHGHMHTAVTNDLDREHMLGQADLNVTIRAIELLRVGKLLPDALDKLPDDVIRERVPGRKGDDFKGHDLGRMYDRRKLLFGGTGLYDL